MYKSVSSPNIRSPASRDRGKAQDGQWGLGGWVAGGGGGIQGAD